MGKKITHYATCREIYINGVSVYTSPTPCPSTEERRSARRVYQKERATPHVKKQKQENEIKTKLINLNALNGIEHWMPQLPNTSLCSPNKKTSWHRYKQGSCREKLTLLTVSSLFSNFYFWSESTLEFYLINYLKRSNCIPSSFSSPFGFEDLVEE